jgi:uncharacterized protein (DUF1800 family)
MNSRLRNIAPLSRRELLAAGAVTGSLAALGGCEKVISTVTQRLGTDVPEAVAVPAGAKIDPAHHLISRAGYGPWPGDVDRIRATGEEKWIDAQLHPESIDDTLCDLRARRFEELQQAPGECYEYDKEVLRRDMSRHTLLRAVYSRRQLFEVMVGFWTDHLNINIEKGDCIYLKPYDDREVIRKHALGKFRDLIRASSTSAAMLVYLDGNQNARAKPTDVPNENYGRELLELHTLGVHGGYTQRDVFEAARALTGWRVRKKFRRGTVYFDPDLHDQGEKTVLGHVIAAAPGGKGGTSALGRLVGAGGAERGETDVDELVDIACRHPSTARHIATKLVRKFVAEEPPAELVERIAQVFRDTDGDIKSLVRAVLTSDGFKASRGTKFKPPFRFVASALRAAGADTHAHDPLIEYLHRMGQGVFQYPTPDGYPDKASPWLGTLLWRWNFAFALATNAVPTVTAPWEKLAHAIGGGSGEANERLFRYFAGHDPSDEQKRAIGDAVAAGSARADVIALALASPSFQKY